MTPRALVAAVSLAAALAACDEKPSAAPPPAAGSAEVAPRLAPSAATAAPKAEVAPSLEVDAQGVLVGGARFDPSTPEGDARLREAIARGKVASSASLFAARAAKTRHVDALVAALAAAGATDVAIATPGRGSVTGPLHVAPASVVARTTPDCAAVAAVRKDGTTATWRIKGGVATRHAKGLAGPDLSTTLEALRVHIGACSATTWFFGADESVPWGLAFDLGASVAFATPPTKATTTALLTDSPVAGRSVKLTP